MRIAVNTKGDYTYYLNFDLIVDFSFERGKNEDVVHFKYSSTTEEDCYEVILITKEEKNRILNKLDLL